MPISMNIFLDWCTHLKVLAQYFFIFFSFSRAFFIFFFIAQFLFSGSPGTLWLLNCIEIFLVSGDVEWGIFFFLFIRAIHSLTIDPQRNEIAFWFSILFAFWFHQCSLRAHFLFSSPILSVRSIFFFFPHFYFIVVTTIFKWILMNILSAFLILRLVQMQKKRRKKKPKWNELSWAEMVKSIRRDRACNDSAKWQSKCKERVEKSIANQIKAKKCH